MNSISKKLADALREALDTLDAVRSCAEYEAHSIVDLLDRKPAREALAAYDAFMLGVAEAHSDVTTHVAPDLIETYDAGRASVRGVED